VTGDHRVPEGQLAQYALRVGDDALIAAQRLAEWSARAPEMEEDIALSNIALDQLGVARFLLSLAGGADGRSEDDLAYLRDDAEFRNCLLAEVPNGGPTAPPGASGDFGVTMVKLLLLGAYQLCLYERLVDSSEASLAEVAGKARKESRYHVDHAAQWTVRLGDGTATSQARVQQALDDLWPYTHELFEDDPLAVWAAEAGVGPLPSSLRAAWDAIVLPVLEEATLTVPPAGWHPTGGRDGRHTEHLSYLLAELQVLHRAHPGASW
jgi:ring-1,2-phenylacetyl-CoA epoxidase subunit PaaC